MNKSKNRILIIDPSEIVVEGLSNIINHSKDFVVTEKYSDITLYNKSFLSQYEIIIVNPMLINYSDYDNIKYMFKNDEKPIVALLYNALFDDNILKKFDGVINIFDDKDHIIKKLSSFIESRTSGEGVAKSELSQREREVLIALAMGKANKQIADELNLSVFTVITHRKNISHKLGINSVSGLTVYAIMNNLIDMSDF